MNSSLVWNKAFFEGPCWEKNGLHIRKVRRLQNDAATIDYLFEKLQLMPSMFSNTPLLDKEPIIKAMSRDIRLFMVDEVGIIGLEGFEQIPASLNVHISFWDQRLRGRELLCRNLASLFMKQYGVAMLQTAIPASSKATIAFAKRCGFHMIDYKIGATRNLKNEKDDIVVLAML